MTGKDLRCEYKIFSVTVRTNQIKVKKLVPYLFSCRVFLKKKKTPQNEKAKLSHVCLGRVRSAGKSKAPQFEIFPHFMSVLEGWTLKSQPLVCEN